MGCIQAKGTTHSPTNGLAKLKLDNGYVQGRNAQKQAHNKASRPKVDVKNEAVATGGGGRERKISREGERGINGGGNVSQRISVKKLAVDELVGGWPKWLVEHVPSDVLAGFVPSTADSYDKLSKVGHGTYSNVYKARHKFSGKVVALKKVRFDTSEPESVKFMAREIIMLKHLDHPNIIKLEGIATSRMQYSLYLVFDFMPSDLAKVISRSERRLTAPQVKCYMQQLLSGLQHCHEREILHRDIKGSNLLIDRNGVLKIADFGLANFYKNRAKPALTSRVVTLWYRAPELLLGSTDYGVGIDLWSAGCLLAEMFEGRPIMPGRNEIEQLHKIFKLCGSPPEHYWKKLKPPTTFRPPQHYKPCFKETFPGFPDSAFGLLGRLLALDPAHRGTAASALENEFFCTSPLACNLSGLPVISTTEDETIQSNNRRRTGKAQQLSSKNHGGYRRKVSFHEHIREIQTSHSFQSLDTINSTSSTSTTTKQSSQETLPHSLSPVFHSMLNISSKTEAHPNALKNIKNYPLLLASLTEAANHLEESKSNLHRRSFSNIDFRNLDLEKISRLFGLEDN
ncbi:probable serine threonine- kinase At1g54610 [Olea europaea subsp. europaea]|uniref:Probable serine threonine- kinase At1g54610 n=1 Tax=Olea europaea subsp. europaea TaxID=158383 RepID=A0A8S0RMS9_OLEEU|nr:probable serine threonine- kinase At1g54610 [Olea europaea subsp. europaea]